MGGGFALPVWGPERHDGKGDHIDFHISRYRGEDAHFQPPLCKKWGPGPQQSTFFDV